MFEDLEHGCSPWLFRSRRKPTSTQQLFRIDIGSLAPAEGKANDVNPIAVENNELIFQDRPRITTPFANRMAQLHIQAQVLQSSPFEIFSIPFLSHI